MSAESAAKVEADGVKAALSNLRVCSIGEEFDLQKDIAQVLTESGIGFDRERILGPRNRVDFLTRAGVAIEAKKGKPNRARVYAQVERYAAFKEVKSIILVVETSLRFPLPDIVNGKPCSVFGLQKLWGIAL